ncbi:hypothetical protein VN97_g7192 [Penicillium thymicola]|uniref:Uncharacterized protein n=1 Tax=Penicillium thymicola TaxID=293382 RepID=A0AAI9X7A0_PENTH|nr:hypothetical protein VN97_g7192 [Penicillium thymicola]
MQAIRFVYQYHIVLICFKSKSTNSFINGAAVIGTPAPGEIHRGSRGNLYTLKGLLTHSSAVSFYFLIF